METFSVFRMFAICWFIFSILGLREADAEVLRLNSAVQEALSNSPKIQKAKSQYSEAEWKKIETYSGFLPNLSANVSYLFDKRYVFFDVNLAGNSMSIPQVVPTTNYYLSAQWSLFDGFTSVNRYRSAEAFKEASKNEYGWARFLLEREVILLFYQALVAKEFKTVAEQNLNALENHLKNVRLFRKAGSSTNYDVLRVEVQLNEAQTELMNASNNLEIALGRLSESMGRELNVDDVDGVLPKLNTNLLAEITEPKTEDRGDLESLRQKVEGFRYQENSSERYWVPRITLSGQYQYYNNRDDRFDDFDKFRDAFQYGLILTWNIFDGMTSISRSKQSIEQKYQAEKSLRQAQLKAKRDFDLWKKKFSYFCKVFDARLDSIIKSEESVRLSLEGQRVGSRTNTDVLDAEAELYRAKAGALTAQIGAIEAILNLEMTMGKKLIDFY